jgi:hypothetical protein
MKAGDLAEIEVELFRSDGDPSPCIIRHSAACSAPPCHCPKESIKNTWLDIDVISNDPSCGPGECRVVAMLNVGANYVDCYHFYRRVGDPNTYILHPHAVVLDTCVANGDVVNISVDILKEMVDPAPCNITKTSLPCDISCCNLIDVKLEREGSADGFCCWKYSFEATNPVCVIPANRISVEFYEDALGTIPIITNYDRTFCTSLTPLPSSGVIYYKVIIDGETCGNIKSVPFTCDCACPGPSEYESWFTVEAVADPSCGENECALQHTIDITQIDPCYTSFQIRDETDAVIRSSTPIAQLQSILSQYDRCMEQGETYTIKIDLLIAAAGAGACQLEGSAFCPVDTEPPTICVPDCEQVAFEMQEDFPFYPQTCPGCEVIVSYATRTSCNGDKDIQILGLHKISNTPNACENCDDRDIHQEAIHRVIQKNAMKFDMPESGHCDTLFRISQATCWGELIKFNVQGSTIQVITVSVPCESACCVRRIRLCNTPLGMIPEPIGPPAGQSGTCDPDGIFDKIGGVVDVLVPSSGGCRYKCHYMDDLDRLSDLLDDDWVDDGPIDFNDPNLYRQGNQPKDSTQAAPSKHGEFQITQTDTELTVEFSHTSLLQAQVALYNVTGQMLEFADATVDTGSATLSVPLTDIASGTYYVSIYVDGQIVTTKNIVIVK